MMVCHKRSPGGRAFCDLPLHLRLNRFTLQNMECVASTYHGTSSHSMVLFCPLRFLCARSAFLLQHSLGCIELLSVVGTGCLGSTVCCSRQCVREPVGGCLRAPPPPAVRNHLVSENVLPHLSWHKQLKPEMSCAGGSIVWRRERLEKFVLAETISGSWTVSQ